MGMQFLFGWGFETLAKIKQYQSLLIYLGLDRHHLSSFIFSELCSLWRLMLLTILISRSPTENSCFIRVKIWTQSLGGKGEDAGIGVFV